MGLYNAKVVWTRPPEAPFTDGKYSRGHEWRFDGGTVVPASSSPQVVPPPLSPENAVDPEEAFVASLSSCHMLFFLAFAAKGGFVVDRYEDDAVGELGKNDRGRTAMLKVVLRPQVTYTGKQPTPEELDRLHHRAHDQCYIGNSTTAEVVIEPR